MSPPLTTPPLQVSPHGVRLPVSKPPFTTTLTPGAAQTGTGVTVVVLTEVTVEDLVCGDSMHEQKVLMKLLASASKDEINAGTAVLVDLVAVVIVFEVFAGDALKVFVGDGLDDFPPAPVTGRARASRLRPLLACGAVTVVVEMTVEVLVTKTG